MTSTFDFRAINVSLLNAGMSATQANQVIAQAINTVTVGPGKVAAVKPHDPKIEEEAREQERDTDILVTTNQGGRAFTTLQQTTLLRFISICPSDTLYTSKEEMNRTVMESMVPWLCGTEQAGLAAVSLLLHCDIESMLYRRQNALLVLAILAKLGATQRVRESAFGASIKMVRTLNCMAQYIVAYQEIGRGMKRPDGTVVGKGWGRAFKRSLDRWFKARSPEKLLYLFAKYKGRKVTFNGQANVVTWSDVLRLTKPKPSSDDYSKVFGFAGRGSIQDPGETIQKQYQAVCLARDATPDQVRSLMERYGNLIAWEMFPTETIALQYHDVFPNMPAHAMIRNLNKISFDQYHGCLEAFKSRFGTREAVAKTKMNPVNLLIALTTYQAGHGLKSSSTWEVDNRVVVLMERAVEYSFHECRWTDRRIEFDLDVSGSMSARFGDTPMSCCQMTGILAYLALLRDPQISVMAFCNTLMDLKGDCKSVENSYGRSLGPKGYIGQAGSYKELLTRMSNLNFGGTDPSLGPKHQLDLYRQDPDGHKTVDCFVIVTDNDVGQRHASEAHLAIRRYREVTGRPDIMMVVVGLTANQFTIADPDDPYMLDVAGFDPSFFDRLVTFIDTKGGSKVGQGTALADRARARYCEAS